MSRPMHGPACIHVSANESAATSAWLFRQMLEKLPVGAYMCDSEGLITFHNESAAGLWGRTPRLNESVDRYCGSFRLFSTSGEPIEHASCWMALALRTGRSYNGREIVIERPDGSRITALAHANPLYDEAGILTGAVNVLVDINDRKEAEESVRASEERFRLLAETLPSILWIASPDGTIDYVNEHWSRYSEQKNKQTMASWVQLLHEDDRPHYIAAWNGAVKSGSELKVEARQLCHDGVYRWFASRAAPLRNAQGELVQWFGTTTDIDEQKRTQERTYFLADASAALAELTDRESSLQRLASIAVPYFADWCAIYIVDGEDQPTRLALMHADAAKLQRVREFERDRPAALASPWSIGKVLDSGESHWFSDLTAVPEAAEDLDQEARRLVQELGLRSCMGIPIRTHRKILGVLVFATAESRRAYTANDLTVAEDLASRVAISLENVALIQALKEADKRKDEFLALLAHELRNPLAPIRNALEILFTEEPSANRLDWARGLIDRQVQQLTRLVDDLLDVSRITRDKIELRKETITLDSVVNSAVEASRPLIDSFGHRLVVDLPQKHIYLFADSTRLAQALLNLLNNAAKYTPAGGRIQLSASLEEAHVVLVVNDNGIGISPDMLNDVFDIFFQADRTLDRAKGGLGIGLTLVKKLVELHGGSVAVRSSGQDCGSEFLIRLPLAAKTPAWENPDPCFMTEPANRYRVLVVDDNRDAAESLEMLFSLWGHEVYATYDGLSAVEKAIELRPQVMLLDIGLPRMNGYEAARKIRAQLGNDIYLIAVTGWGQEEDRKNSQEAGFNIHLTKPIECDMLQQLLAGTPLLSQAGAAFN